MAVAVIRKLLNLLDVNADAIADGETLVWDDATEKFIPGSGGAGGGAPDDAAYLVTTADPSLSAEVVVGVTPGGELGGTWASPTVDTTHSGSSHASVQAAAEATAAAALLAHTTDSADAHDASAISVLDAAGDFTATDVEGALAELQSDHETDAQNLSDHIADATAAHAATAVSFAPAGTIAATTVQAAIEEVAAEAGGGSGEALQRDITQAAHGLAVGDVVRLNGSTWQKAQANSAANSEVAGIVASVADANTFTLHYGGRITGLSGLSAGSVYYLDDDTAGLLTTTEPPDAGDISKPLLIADSTTTGYFFNWRGAVKIDMATQAELDAHVNDTSDAHDASAISFSPTGTIAATDVQAALAEVASEAGGGGGTKTIQLLPGAATLPDGSSGNSAPALTRIQGTEANPKKHFLALLFDGNGGVEYAWWSFILPSDYASGGTLELYWMLNGTSNAVKWQARVGAVTADDADTPYEHASAAAATVTTNVNTTEARRLTKSTISLTMDSAAAEDLIILTVFRDSTDGSDTSTVDAELVGAAFKYSA